MSILHYEFDAANPNGDKEAVIYPNIPTPINKLSANETNNIRDKLNEIIDNVDGLAPINSPAFTGFPTAPTAPQGTANTQIATTEFVNSEILALPLATTSYVNLGCVVRWDISTSTWVFVDDSLHSPIYATTVIVDETASGNYNFQINYPEVEKVGSFEVVVDEAYARQGLFVGASVNTTSAKIRVHKQGMAIKFNCTSGVWTMPTDSLAIVSPSQFTGSFDTGTGNLTISHPALVFEYTDDIILEVYNNSTLKPEYVAKTSTSFTIRFRDAAGVILTTPTNAMDFIVNRTGTFRVPNANLALISAGANFWVQGIFHKTGISGNVPFDYPIDYLPTENSTNLVYSGGVFDALALKADSTSLNNKVTKGGDTDGASLVIGTNNVQNVEIRRNSVERIFIDNNSVNITSNQNNPAPVFKAFNSVNGNTGDLLAAVQMIGAIPTLVAGIRPSGRVFGSDATASNDFLTKGQYDAAKAIVDSALTTTQTASTLNTKYPSVPFPYVVFAPNVGSSMTYVKVNATQWMSYSGVLLS